MPEWIKVNIPRFGWHISVLLSLLKRTDLSFGWPRCDASLCRANIVRQPTNQHKQKDELKLFSLSMPHHRCNTWQSSSSCQLPLWRPTLTHIHTHIHSSVCVCSLRQNCRNPVEIIKHIEIKLTIHYSIWLFCMCETVCVNVCICVCVCDVFARRFWMEIYFWAAAPPRTLKRCDTVGYRFYCIPCLALMSFAEWTSRFRAEEIWMRNGINRCGLSGFCLVRASSLTWIQYGSGRLKLPVRESSKAFFSSEWPNQVARAPHEWGFVIHSASHWCHGLSSFRIHRRVIYCLEKHEYIIPFDGDTRSGASRAPLNHHRLPHLPHAFECEKF